MSTDTKLGLFVLAALISTTAALSLELKAYWLAGNLFIIVATILISTHNNERKDN